MCVHSGLNIEVDQACPELQASKDVQTNLAESCLTQYALCEHCLAGQQSPEKTGGSGGQTWAAARPSSGQRCSSCADFGRGRSPLQHAPSTLMQQVLASAT